MNRDALARCCRWCRAERLATPAPKEPHLVGEPIGYGVTMLTPDGKSNGVGGTYSTQERAERAMPPHGHWSIVALIPVEKAK